MGAGQSVGVPQADLNLRAFLMNVYPDLAGREIQIETTGRTEGIVEISVGEVIDDGSPAGGRSPLLKSAVAFFPDYELRSFEASGVFLESEDNATLAAAVRAAREAGQTGDAVINSAALPYGPDQRAAMLNRVDALHLEKSIGTTRLITATAVTGPADARYGFVWVVVLEGQRSGESAKPYTLTFEPFAGRLVSMEAQ